MMVDEITLPKMVAYFNTGKTVVQVARNFCVSRSTAFRALKQAGVTATTLGPPRQQVVGADGLRPCHGRCKKRLPASAFNKNLARPDKLHHSCRACWGEYQAERTLARKFGLTWDDFAALLKSQGGGCGICGRRRGMLRLGRRLRLCVDHCHKTGRVRGILCNDCNFGLGSFKDDPTLLKAAARYLG